MEEITQYWKKNRRQVRLAITHLNRFHLRAIRRKTKVNELLLDNLFAKLLLPLWVSLLETEFNILLYENYAFTKKFMESTNVFVLSECDKWIALTGFFFREQYLGSHKRQLTIITLGDTNYHRYTTIVEVINDDLKPYIELRNRIAHGQWAIAFNTGGTTANQKITQHAWTLSKKDLMLLKAFMGNLIGLLKLLIISKNTFERDYDQYINRINLAKKDINIRFLWLTKSFSET